MASLLSTIRGPVSIHETEALSLRRQRIGLRRGGVRPECQPGSLDRGLLQLGVTFLMVF